MIDFLARNPLMGVLLKSHYNIYYNIKNVVLNGSDEPLVYSLT